MTSAGRRAALAAALALLGLGAYATLSRHGGSTPEPVASETHPSVESGSPPASLAPAPGAARPTADREPRPAPLPKERRLVVRVEDAEGRPVPGALVRAVAARRSSESRALDLEEPEVLTGIADSTGRLELGLVGVWDLPGLRVAAELADGWRCSSARTVPTDATEVVLLLRSAWWIRGTVTGAPGLDLTRAVVLAELSAGPDAPRRRRIPVASDGSFTVLGVSRHARLYAALAGRQTSAPWDGVLTVGAETALVLELGPPGTPVAIEAVYEEGDPAAGIAVWLSSPGDPGHAVRLDSRGSGSTSQLAPAGEVRVYVPPSRGADGTFSSLGYMASQRAPMEEDRLHVTLSRCVRSRFLLRTAAGEGVGTDLDGLTFLLVPDARGQGTRGFRVRDGSISPARDRALSPGPYRLEGLDGSVLWSGPLTSEDLAIPVTLPAGRAVEVEWTDAHGAPVSGSSFRAAVLDEDEVKSGKFDERRTGHFTAFDAGSRRRFWVPDGRRSVIVGMETGLELQQREAPPVGATEPVRFVTSRQGARLRIHGGVRFDLEPGFIVNLHSVSGDGPSYHAPVDGSGTAAFPSVVPGRYTVAIPIEHVVAAIPDFDFAARADELVEVRLP